jgi:hypothetical protein
MAPQLQVNDATPHCNIYSFSPNTNTNTVIINWQDSARPLTFNLADVGFSSAIATNLITGHVVGSIKQS